LLDEAGVAHVAVSPESIADTREMIVKLGRLVGRAGAAAALVGRIDEGLAGVADSVEGRAPVRVAWVMAGTPPWVAGPGTFIHELVELAGGENVFADLDRPWAPVSPETVLAREPDVLVVPEGGSLDDRITGAAPVRRVPGFVQLPGADLAEAAREIAHALHPDLFR
ncbi:MAG TPA: ABC transporter substrate-binding protein, partial [Longimicrobiales bacterium]|nr:ABC transporter substrate-binding protein [Longimicrobiales bacterium]